MRRLRRWWYWRKFESPGKTLAQQQAFAERHLNRYRAGLWV